MKHVSFLVGIHSQFFHAVEGFITTMPTNSLLNIYPILNLHMDCDLPVNLIYIKICKSMVEFYSICTHIGAVVFLFISLPLCVYTDHSDIIQLTFVLECAITVCFD